MRPFRWPLFVLALAAALASCRQSESAKYASAAVTAGIGVAAAAVNRAVTDECWGACSPGFGCDEKSGLCVPIDELEDDPRPALEEGEDDGCILEDDGRRVCPDDPEPARSAPEGSGGAGGGAEGGGGTRDDGDGGAQNDSP